MYVADCRSYTESPDVRRLLGQMVEAEVWTVVWCLGMEDRRVVAGTKRENIPRVLSRLMHLAPQALDSLSQSRAMFGMSYCSGTMIGAPARAVRILALIFKPEQGVP